MHCGMWRRAEAIAEKKYSEHLNDKALMISLCCCMNYPTIPQLQVPKQMLMWRFFQDFRVLASQQSKILRKSVFFSFLLFSFLRHCMVKSQDNWLFKEVEGKFVKDRQICHSECCPGGKNKSKNLLPWATSGLFLCFEMTSYFGISLGTDIQRVCQFKPLFWFSCYSYIKWITLCPVS